MVTMERDFKIETIFFPKRNRALNTTWWRTTKPSEAS